MPRNFNATWAKNGHLTQASQRYTCLRDHFEDGKSLKEIAETQNVSEQRVAALINQGASRLSIYKLPQDVCRAAQILQQSKKTPKENIVEILAILTSHPDDNVLDLISLAEKTAR